MRVPLACCEVNVRHRHSKDQSAQGLCLTVVTNAIVVSTTDYLYLAVGQQWNGQISSPCTPWCLAASWLPLQEVHPAASPTPAGCRNLRLQSASAQLGVTSAS